MPKLDLDTIPQTNKTGYPGDFAIALAGRWYRQLGAASGLTDLGVSYGVIEPGAWSSQRPWHVGEDEFLVMLSDDAVLLDNEGEHPLRAGDCASFPNTDGNRHHLQNRSDAACVFVAVSGRSEQGGPIPISTWHGPPTIDTFPRTARPIESLCRSGCCRLLELFEHPFLGLGRSQPVLHEGMLHDGLDIRAGKARYRQRIGDDPCADRGIHDVSG